MKIWWKKEQIYLYFFVTTIILKWDKIFSIDFYTLGEIKSAVGKYCLVNKNFKTKYIENVDVIETKNKIAYNFNYEGRLNIWNGKRKI